MPADFSKYVDLRVFDIQPGDIYLESIRAAQTTLPEFNLRIGTPEDAMFQAMAYISSLNIAAINRLPDRLMAGILSILGFNRQQAIPAEIDVEIVLDNYLGGFLPEGTLFSYETTFEDERTEYVFQTTEPITFEEVPNPNSLSSYPTEIVTVVALNGGVIPPISTPGTTLNVLSSGTGIFSVTTHANFAQGINADDEYEYLSKGATYIRSLTSAINKSTQLESYLLTNYSAVLGRVKCSDLTYGEQNLGDISVNRFSLADKTFRSSDKAVVKIIGNNLFVVGDKVDISGCGSPYDGEHTLTAVSSENIEFIIGGSGSSSSATVSGSVESGADNPGYVTIFGYGLNAFLTSSEKSLMINDVRKKSVAGLEFYIRDPDLVTLSASASIVISPSFDQETLANNIKTVMSDYLSPQNFPYLEGVVRHTKLISLLSNINGVVYVQSLQLEPLGEGWLPKYGEDLLFLNKGSLPITDPSDFYFTYTLAPE